MVNKNYINTLYQHNMNDEFQNQIKDESQTENAPSK